MGRVSNSQSEEKCSFCFLSLDILFNAPGAEVRSAICCMRCSSLAVVYMWNKTRQKDSENQTLESMYTMYRQNQAFRLRLLTFILHDLLNKCIQTQMHQKQNESRRNTAFFFFFCFELTCATKLGDICSMPASLNQTAQCFWPVHRAEKELEKVLEVRGNEIKSERGKTETPPCQSIDLTN